MFNKNLIIKIVIVLAVIIGGSLLYLNRDKIEISVLSPQKAAEKAINYINQQLGGQTTATLIETKEESGVYKIRLKVQEQEFTSYITKNGKILFVEGISLGSDSSTQANNTSGEPTKTDKPDVKLFVMSYCPFGLQMEKAFLPVYNLLKDKVDMGIYFVDYIMHDKKEIDENLRQYCIQKEEKEKYADYLSCFTQSGDATKCLSSAGADQTKLANCISQTDKDYNITAQYQDKNTWVSGNYPKFDVNKDLNEKYGVQGSPTLVINDKVVDISNRSPEELKKVICQAFKSEPQECSQTLSTESASSGFGTGTSSNSGGSCE